MPDVVYRQLIHAMWLAWALYWCVSAIGMKATARREPMVSRLLHVVPLLAALWLLGARSVPGRWLNERLFAWAPWEFWLAALMTAAGLGFTVWARVHIGRNWSGTVTLKQGHELVVSGPYALVRHPIYTGLLLALVGSALARGEWRGVLAVAIAWASLWRKLRLEEAWMVEAFGERYEAYLRRVPALIPFTRA
jgi:protein-S-isoprenylcysteine O-methyltransferase Ste14